MCFSQSSYDIVIKGGHVIDPKNNIDAVMDIAIKGNKIAMVAQNIMSNFLALGLPLQDVINRSTWQPALIFNRPDLGNLSVGSEADVAILSINKGNFGFRDIANETIKETEKFVAELTIRAGRIVWDLNGLTATEFQK